MPVRIVRVPNAVCYPLVGGEREKKAKAIYIYDVCPADTGYILPFTHSQALVCYLGERSHLFVDLDSGILCCYPGEYLHLFLDLHGSGLCCYLEECLHFFLALSDEISCCCPGEHGPLPDPGVGMQTRYPGW